MADLNNLLGELEEEIQELKAHLGDDDADYDKFAGRPSVETAATEPMTPGRDWDSPSSPPRRRIAVPAALQEAKRRQLEENHGSAAESVNVEESRGYSEGLVDLLTGDATMQDEGQMNEMYTQLHHYWHQEKHCPELLEYNAELVEHVKGKIEARQAWIDQILEDTTSAAGGGLDAGQASVQHLLATLAQVDLDRVKYVLANWLAQRLSKIEAHPLHMRERVDHMSDAELAYLKEYGSLLEDHLRQTVLDQIPEAWQGLDEAHMIDQPDYDGYHFWVVNEPIEVDEVEQDEGSCLVARYSAMRDVMREGKVELRL